MLNLSTKLDRRKQYTRMVLMDSLVALLQEKQISTITIKEICELADINRSTFYAHYSNQYDLLHSIEEKFIQDMMSALEQYNFSKEEEAFLIIEKILEFIANNKIICQVLLDQSTERHFQKQGTLIIKKFIFNQWIAKNTLDRHQFEYISIFVVGGSVFVIKNWLETGMKESYQEMAEIINNLINKGLSTMR
ncbi:TetR/AcrR family transcriptional regulator [Cytobacillus gottheilii]|uniref:TetR/AcrR family transcriptional regulator n=1 Tax=Cytobacillus gottheilii TaxID=859144 RepID=UPI0021492A00|nr:TetR-like C-terminal domain-containing protein [Cytobacillus gottheilii]